MKYYLITGAFIVLVSSCGLKNPEKSQPTENTPKNVMPGATSPAPVLATLGPSDNPRPVQPVRLDSTPMPEPTKPVPPVQTPSSSGSIPLPAPGQTSASISGISASDSVVLYGNENCGFCTFAKDFLKSKNISFTFRDVNQNQEFRKDIQPYGGGRYPFVFINGKFIGHLTELQNVVNGISTPIINPAPVQPFISNPTPLGPDGVPQGFKSDKSVVLYGNQKTCGLCHEAERLLKEKGIDYDFKDVFENTAYLVYLHTNIGSHKFPYVYINGKHIGGLDELREWLKK